MQIYTTNSLPEEFYRLLPSNTPLYCLGMLEGIERDNAFFLAMSFLGGCLPNYEGLYHYRSFTPHTYNLLVGPPTTGKGILLSFLDALAPIEEVFERENKERLRAYTSMPESERVKHRMPLAQNILIPANTTGAAFVQELQANERYGCMMYAQEIRSLSNSLSGPHASTLGEELLVAYEHGRIGKNIKGEYGLTQVKRPKLGLVLTGTPEDARDFFTKTGGLKNGLLTRFVVRQLHDRRKYICTPGFAKGEGFGVEEAAQIYGQFVFEIFQTLKRRTEPLRFKLPQICWNITSKIEEWQARHSEDVELCDHMFRYGLAATKQLMVLTLANNWHTAREKVSEISPSDVDYRLIELLMEYQLEEIVSYRYGKQGLGIKCPMKKSRGWNDILLELPSKFAKINFVNKGMKDFDVHRDAAYKAFSRLEKEGLLVQVGETADGPLYSDAGRQAPSKEPSKELRDISPSPSENIALPPDQGEPPSFPPPDQSKIAERIPPGGNRSSLEGTKDWNHIDQN